MLARYKIYRGKRPADDPLPAGVRQDTRKHVGSHCLHPEGEQVTRYLEMPTDKHWQQLQKHYQALLERRYRKDPAPFLALAELAEKEDVYLGCNCPTARNPDVNRCHTVLALRFMQQKFPKLKVVYPPASRRRDAGRAGEQ